jgi:hypothetical protein
MFVDAIIQGRETENIAVVPRSSLHPGDEVYVVDPENRLDIRKVEVLTANESEAIIESGLENGDRIAASPLAAPVEGMKLSVLNKKSTGQSMVADQDPPASPVEPDL